METYKIIRFYENQRPTTLQTGLTIRQAQALTQKPDAKTKRWHDEYFPE